MSEPEEERTSEQIAFELGTLQFRPEAAPYGLLGGG